MPTEAEIWKNTAQSMVDKMVQYTKDIKVILDLAHSQLANVPPPAVKVAEPVIVSE